MNWTSIFNPRIKTKISNDQHFIICEALLGSHVARLPNLEAMHAAQSELNNASRPTNREFDSICQRHGGIKL